MKKMSSVTQVLALSLLVFAVGCKSTTAKKGDAASASPQSGGGQSQSADTSADDKKKLEELMKQAQAAGASAEEAKKLAEQALAEAKKKNSAQGGASQSTGRVLECTFMGNGSTQTEYLNLPEIGSTEVKEIVTSKAKIAYSAEQNKAKIVYTTLGENSVSATAEVELSDLKNGSQDFDVNFEKDGYGLSVICEDRPVLKAEEEKYDDKSSLSLTRSAIYECSAVNEKSEVSKKDVSILVYKTPEDNASDARKGKTEVELQNNPLAKVVADSSRRDGELELQVTEGKDSNAVKVSIETLSNIKSFSILTDAKFMSKPVNTSCVRTDKPVLQNQNANAENKDATEESINSAEEVELSKEENGNSNQQTESAE